MKIAMIGQKGIPAIHGGVEKHVHDLSVRLVERGCEVTVYARKWYTGSRGTDYIEGVKRIHTPTIRTKHLDAIVHVFTSTIHALFSKYDVIHYHSVGPALLAWIPRIFSPRTRVIITLHSLDRLQQKWGRLAQYVLKLGEKAACFFADETITVSKQLQAYALREYHVETIFIPNGIEVPKVSHGDVEHIKSFGLSKDKYIVMVSRLLPNKGAHILIEAFKLLKERYREDTTIQSLKLAIVGGAVYTDKYVRTLHTLAGSVNDIIFTDFQTSGVLQELFQNAWALVHPSFNEGLPFSVLEGMSYGLPVLLSSIPEHQDMISDPRIFFKENDVESLVECLVRFVHMTNAERKLIGKNNKAIILEYYDIENVVTKIEQVYKNSISEKSLRISEESTS